MLSLSQKVEFDLRLKQVQTDSLVKFLNSLKAPCYESDLMKVALPWVDLLNISPLALYQNHFLLFHELYRLQEIYLKNGQYLFIHFMRTFLVNLPESGKCRFYEEHFGKFCLELCENGEIYCNFHKSRIGEHKLWYLSDKYFYLDPANFFLLDEASAELFINGAWEILINRKIWEKSFAVLGLPVNTDLKTVRITFRELAKSCHPDLGHANEERFKEINNAYHLIMHFWSKMPKWTESQKSGK